MTDKRARLRRSSLTAYPDPGEYCSPTLLDHGAYHAETGHQIGVATCQLAGR